jgi:hypothetical protein
MDVLLVALMPPRRRASFLLGGAVSSSMLRGDSETECLLEDVVDDGLDDDDPFFLENKLVVFFHMLLHFSPLKFWVATSNLALNTYFRMWTLSGLRLWIFSAIKLGKVGYVYGGSGHTNLNTQTEEGDGSLPVENGNRGAP